jgi:DNA gyrase/topoisomerase IV subunit B
MSASEEIVVSTLAEHMEAKGMWAGALERVVIPNLLGAVAVAPTEHAAAESDADTPESDAALDAALDAASDAGSDAASDTASVAASEAASVACPPKIALVSIERPHTPALMKAADEVIVNATDRKSHGVKEIRVDFDRATGRITVFNDGPGIPIVQHAGQSALLGRPVYMPEIALGIPLAGSNINKEASSVKGGTNGLGAKIANVHSTEFTVETCDGKQIYRQTWHGLARVSPAEFSPAKRAKPFTRVSFVLAFAKRGYPLGPGGVLAPEDSADFDNWLRLRTYQSAAYMGARISVSYNGSVCETTDAAGLARVLAASEAGSTGTVFAAVARSKVEPWSLHPWDVAVVLMPAARRGRRSAAATTMAVVNGVMTNKGTHVDYVRAALVAAINARLKAAGSPPCSGAAEALAGVRLVIIGGVPGADWSGQRKDELQVAAKAVANWPTLPAAFLKRAADAIAVQLMRGAAAAPSRPVVHDKYRPARHAGKAQRAQTRLLAAEGDSAITLLVAGLTQMRGAATPGGPTLDWNGIISLQGVIINAKREVSQMDVGDGAVAVRSARLRDNKRLAALADAFGLRYDCRYETAAERATLRYGQLVLCVDQDLDGTGKIAALVLVWLNEFWPALLQNGCVGRFMTPLVRAYPKGRAAVVAPLAVAQPAKGRRKGVPPAVEQPAALPICTEFFYEEELRAWLAEDPGRSTSHTIKFYKGLATHDASEVGRMFTPEQFQRSLYTYTVEDAKAVARGFEIYFGADPALRKAVLVTPVVHLNMEEARALHVARHIPVGRVQLDIDAKSFKNDAIKRQLPSAVDALNPARRKIIFAAIARFAGEAAARELKVFQLGGYVADKMFYHHGDMSLNSTIVYLAQAFAGARRYPLLEGVGQFGSRHGDAAGSARYISVRLGALTRVLFPAADRWHLPYVFEDGMRAEPQWLAPVAPLAALESGSNISEGWNHDSYARELGSVLAIVDAYIDGDAELHAAATALAAAGDGSVPPPLAAELARLAAAHTLPAETAGYSGRIADYRGVPHSFGAYAYDAATRTVTITDLPIGEATNKYIERITALTGREPVRKPSKAAATAAVRAKPAPTQAKAVVSKAPALVESVRDCSTSDRVRIEVVLTPGAYERIAAGHGDSVIDPIEDALSLRSSMRPHLNYYSAHGGVLELPNDDAGYLATILYWAPRRAAIYRARLERALIVAELRALEETQQLRYTDEAAELDLAKLADAAAASAILRERGYVPLDTPLLHRPEYTANSELRELITQGPGASFDYILDMRSRELVRAAAELRKARLAALSSEADTLRAQLAERPVAGASVWRAELSAFQELAFAMRLKK